MNITNQMINKLKITATMQDKYGLAKYGKPLDHTDHYDWLQMFLEEAADGMKYIQCEMNRKNDVIDLLSSAMKTDDPKRYVKLALEILSIKGTGK